MPRQIGNAEINASQARGENGECFACGCRNARGLGLTFTLDVTDRSASSTFFLEPEFQGAPGIAHGGIVATVVDEAMAYAARACGVTAATGRLSIRYRRHVPLGTALHVFARISDIAHRRLEAVCRLEDAEGRLLAEGTGVLITMSEPSDFQVREPMR